MIPHNHNPNPARTRTVIATPHVEQQGVGTTKLQARELRRLRELKIRDLMERQGLTMATLGGKAGIDHSYVSRIIAGTRTPSLKVTVLMARALRISLQALADLLVDSIAEAPDPTPNVEAQAVQPEARAA